MPKLLTLVAATLWISACTQQKKQVPSFQAKLLYKIEAQLGEGPIWNHRTKELLWVDIESTKLHLYDPTSNTNRGLLTPSRVGTVVPIDDTLAVVALQDGAYTINTQSGSLSLLAPLDSGNLDTRLNDGKCDPQGRFWVGSMHMPQDRADGNLYRIDSAGTSRVMLDSITISNGIVWTKDSKTMYYIDTPTGLIRAFDFNPSSGEISNERTAVVIPEELGFPDGMTIDEEDKLWVGLWNGNAIARFDPLSGELIAKVEVPAHNVTACAFGGANLDTLFITTARVDMTDEELEAYPDAGSLFYVIPDVKGVNSSFYKPARSNGN